MGERVKHWLYAGIVVVLLSTIYIIYHVGVAPYKDNQAQAIKIAKQHADLKTPQTFYLYNRNGQNWTVGGLDKKNHKIFVIINSNNKNIVILDQSAGISQQKAVNKVIARYDPKQIHNVALGLYHKKPVWEVTFQNKNHTIGYETIDFKTGHVVQNINNL
ncbi:DUF5590 domain-containing protein [Agrilactobacillus yilanensis]|uniref:DUF5590 domain-containing protein n=1 Tax=Agrilactobacillus yilanensis TaxID=2485997 RepID=A0ABW4J9G9_9LACO|nr:DUF5590 domain-containing protein [Agrilactobacillus yilanensis]